MMNGWPSVSVSFAPRTRAVTSATPPGATLTTMRTGFAGHCCACAAASHNAATSVKMLRFIAPPKKSLDLDPGILDYLTPLLYLRAHVGGELLRPLAAELVAEVQCVVLHFLRAQDGGDLLVKPLDDRRGRACGHEDAVPAGRFDRRIARLRHRRPLADDAHAPRASHGKAAQLPRLDRIANHHRRKEPGTDMGADQIGQLGADRLVRNL